MADDNDDDRKKVWIGSPKYNDDGTTTSRWMYEDDINYDDKDKTTDELRWNAISSINLSRAMREATPPVSEYIKGRLKEESENITNVANELERRESEYIADWMRMHPGYNSNFSTMKVKNTSKKGKKVYV